MLRRRRKRVRGQVQLTAPIEVHLTKCEEVFACCKKSMQKEYKFILKNRNESFRFIVIVYLNDNSYMSLPSSITSLEHVARD